MINTNTLTNNTNSYLDMSHYDNLLSNIINEKEVAKPIESKLFENYFLLMESLVYLKQTNVLNRCPLYDLFCNSTKIIYEQYSCVDIDKIKINSDKIFMHFLVGPDIPLNFVDDMVENIKSNAYSTCKVETKVTGVKDLQTPKIEIIYSVGDRVTVFDEAELIDIYHGLTVLNLNQELQDKIKNMLTKDF